MGSSFELETQFIIVQELNFIPKEKIVAIIELLNKEQKMVNSLINKLKANS